MPKDSKKIKLINRAALQMFSLPEKSDFNNNEDALFFNEKLLIPVDLIDFKNASNVYDLALHEADEEISLA